MVWASQNSTVKTVLRLRGESEKRGVASPKTDPQQAAIEKNSATLTPHICKKYAPKYAIQWGFVWHKSRLKSRDFYRKYAYGPNFYDIRTPPFMPYEPFLLGVGVVSNLLSNAQARASHRFAALWLFSQCWK